MESKSALLTSTALTTSMALISGAALAADMPVKAPIFAPSFSWSGCYIGGNVGKAGVWGDIDQSVTSPDFRRPIQSSGVGSSVVAGGQVGCNWQYTPNWVFGIEGDINWLNSKRSHNINSEDLTGSQTTKLRWLTTVRARLGYAWGNSLLYLTGGLAGGDVKSSVSLVHRDGGVFSGSISDVRWGWTVGAGYEYAFTRTISGKLEYLHFDLGNVSYPVLLASGSSSLTLAGNAKVTGDLVRVGINIKLTP
jgi:outer membrane immunogenic protein